MHYGHSTDVVGHFRCILTAIMDEKNACPIKVFLILNEYLGKMYVKSHLVY